MSKYSEHPLTSLVEEVSHLLHRKRLTIGVVESASGGLISHLITSVPGCSEYYRGSITSYSNDVKTKVVGVRADTIRKQGAVSEQVACEMAQGGRMLLGVDICLSDTGIAGPGGAEPDKPVGLFYIGFADGEGTYSRKYHIPGDRKQKKLGVAEAALNWLREYLL
jgi:nicotinamide-nucleotide amidase